MVGLPGIHYRFDRNRFRFGRHRTGEHLLRRYTNEDEVKVGLKAEPIVE
ncbi:MAG: hypothetical protein FD118_4118 [Rhodocyclaceae bacterium]|nr:MAG: hypothetical protein FD118_4118 [Rhodocyclaceae bacterium]